VVLTGGRLAVTVPVGQCSGRCEKRSWPWYRTTLRTPAERAAIWAKKLGVAVPVVLIATSGAAGGAAIPKGNLRFNWRIIQAPCGWWTTWWRMSWFHLAHRNHTAGFWAALGRVMPDYEARRERLCQVGRRFEW